MTARTAQVMAVIVGTVGVAGSFVVSTVLMDQTADTVLIAVPLAFACAIAVALGWPELRSASRTMTGRWWWNAATGGILALWAAPLVAMTQRATDAPSGAESLFLTTTLWGTLAVVTAWAQSQRRGSWVGPAVTVLAVGATMAILANWERPSSFSPFTRFIGPEIVMVAAGGLFVIGLMRLRASLAHLHPRATLATALLAAFVVGALVCIPAVGRDLVTVRTHGAALLVLGAFVAASAWGVIGLLGDRRGWQRAALPSMLAPAAVTALSFVERTTGIYGPNPIGWDQVVPGLVALVAAAATVAFTQRAMSRPAVTGRSLVVLLSTLAGGSLVLAAIAMVRPALRALSEGAFSTPFRAEWDMLGYETASGWLVLGAALTVTAVAWSVLKDHDRREAILGSLAAMIAVAAAWLVRASTIHPWNSFVPNDVQQTYGTEYARFSTEPLFSPLLVGAGVLTLITAIAVCVHAVWFSSVPADRTEV